MTIKPTKLIALLLLFALQAFAQGTGATGLTRYVDPFIGTGGHGHTFPGASLPFGMVQLSPDTRLTGWDGCSGYHYSDQIIYGFSHTHLSGTGISDYGDVLLMPTVGEVQLKALPGDASAGGYASHFSHRNESASPGYYSVRLDDSGVRAELTATSRAGLHRYTFPATERANVILDLAHRDRVLDSYLRIVGDRRVEGYRRSTAWATDQIVYFVAEFSKPFKAVGVAPDGRIADGLREARGTDLKAFFQFSTRAGEQLLVRVAISAVDIEGARRNLEAELNTWDFERVKASAASAWERELGRVQAEGGTEAQLKTFYTALYHTLLAPNLFTDVDGRYRGRDLKIHTARGFNVYTVFSLWDTFRAAHPLYTIIERARTRDFIRTFLAQYDEGGRLPVWELAANETDTMIGYHAVSVLADAAVKGVGGFSLAHAFEAMKHSAELNHFGLEAYRRRGYIGAEDEPESVSKTLEYAYDDWCIAQVARLTGRLEDYRRYTERAQFYKNLFDPSTGFMRPKRNGGWLSPFDPREVNFNFTEANSWQYTFFAPHDLSGLIELMGGRENFARELDALFAAESRTTGREQADITGLMGQYAHGNEPSHHIAYLYDYAGQAWKTQARVRRIMDEFYRPAPDGLIGNEDCGQMSAWYLLSAAGFYPVTPGSQVYATGSPLFREVRFRLESGRQFVVKALNNSPRNVYIQSATLDGKPYRRSYITHADLMRGGLLVFQMGSRPNPAWGAGDDAPISKIEGDALVPVPAINAAASVFRGSLEVSLQSPGASVRQTNTAAQETNAAQKIYYTTDGTEPSLTSKLYLGPFSITRDASVKAAAFTSDGRRSLTASAVFRRAPHDWTIRILSRYSPQYAAGGDEALIDGVRGTRSFNTGAWQGYQGQDFEAVVDLGRNETVSKLGAGFLQDVRSWILFPRRVEFSLSTDGEHFTPALAVADDVPDNTTEAITKEFGGAIRPQRARYVRVRAETYGKLPAWHPGAGGDSWIFVDEIIVE
jgi:predicted alpha-1,2-mannosidase